MSELKLADLTSLLEELDTMSPGAGKVHDFNTRRIGLREAIKMYGKPGRDKMIVDEYQTAAAFIIELRRASRGR